MMKRNPSPAERSKIVRAAFEAKVALLERWAREGIPEGAKVPENKTQLPGWKGPDGNLHSWVDRTIFDKHSDLAKRFVKALENIEKRLSAGKDPIKESEAEIAALCTEKRNLELQNASLIGDIDRLQRRIQLLNDLLSANGTSLP